MNPNTHEILKREEAIVVGSDRVFGLVMAGAFALVALINGWHDGHVWPWTAAVAILFLAAALMRPALLNPLNRLWHKFGLLLHWLVSPIVMAILFYGVLLPTSLIMRAPWKDMLRTRLDPGASTYWIDRQPPGPAPETMKDQF